MHSYISTDHVIHEMPLSVLLLLIIIEYIIVRLTCMSMHSTINAQA